MGVLQRVSRVSAVSGTNPLIEACTCATPVRGSKSLASKIRTRVQGVGKSSFTARQAARRCALHVRKREPHTACPRCSGRAPDPRRPRATFDRTSRLQTSPFCHCCVAIRQPARFAPRSHCAAQPACGRRSRRVGSATRRPRCSLREALRACSHVWCETTFVKEKSASKQQSSSPAALGARLLCAIPPPLSPRFRTGF